MQFTLVNPEDEYEYENGVTTGEPFTVTENAQGPQLTPLLIDH